MYCNPFSNYRFQFLTLNQILLSSGWEYIREILETFINLTRSSKKSVEKMMVLWSPVCPQRVCSCGCAQRDGSGAVVASSRQYRQLRSRTPGTHAALKVNYAGLIIFQNSSTKNFWPILLSHIPNGQCIICAKGPSTYYWAKYVGTSSKKRQHSPWSDKSTISHPSY